MNQFHVGQKVKCKFSGETGVIRAIDSDLIYLDLVTKYGTPYRHVSTSANLLQVFDILSEQMAWSTYGPVKIGCDHTYKQYVGIRESYEYCTKCDNKRFT